LAIAEGAAVLGARVALVEKEPLGGQSLHSGSVLAKALIRAARSTASCRQAEHFGVRAHDVSVNFADVMERVRKVYWTLGERNTVPKLLELGIDVFLGPGRFADRSHVAVGERTVAFSRAVIATGGHPIVPEIPGLDPARCLSAEKLSELRELPRRLAVIGAGSTGCEMAQAFARLGSRVTLYDRAPQGLMHDDAEAWTLVQSELERDGVDFRLDTEVLSVECDGSETHVRSQSEDGESTHRCDCVLLAVGRAPRVEDLALDEAGVRWDSQGVWVTPNLRTTNHRILAAGDACAHYRCSHAPEALARVAIANALFFGSDRASDLLIPWCTYTDPEVAHVGISAIRAEEAHLRTLRLPLSKVDGAVVEGTENGFLKLHYDHHGGIRGATLVAPRAADLIGEIVVAMNHGVKLGSLAQDVHLNLSQSELIRLAGDHFRRGLLTPSMSRFLSRLLAWRR